MVKHISVTISENVGEAEGGYMEKFDQFDLKRFIKAQSPVYETVISELRNGKKVTHWMWFIFPQIDGLAGSSTSKYYAIGSAEEAAYYLKHPILGTRIEECAEIVLSIDGSSARDIFGCPDDLKLRSSMTLFDFVSAQESVFSRVLEKYFENERDIRTQTILLQGA